MICYLGSAEAAQEPFARNGGWHKHDAWSMTDLAEMIDANLPKPEKRGPYKRSGEGGGEEVHNLRRSEARDA